MGELVQESRAVEVLDARHSARVRIGAKVAPLDELRERIGDRLRSGGGVPVELRQHILAAQMHDEPALGGHEREHHPSIQSGILSRQVGERLEPLGVGVHRAGCHRRVNGCRRAGRHVADLSTMRRGPSAVGSTFRRTMAVGPSSIRIRTDELRTVREAMRDFGSLLTELEDGAVEKLVLTQRNRIRAVVISVERWSEVEQMLADGGRAQASAPARMPGSAPL
jgi:PHD/YefM family antitoxin component YafN of YafNO toxin-antitoxin module